MISALASKKRLNEKNKGTLLFFNHLNLNLIRSLFLIIRPCWKDFFIVGENQVLKDKSQKLINV